MLSRVRIVCRLQCLAPPFTDRSSLLEPHLGRFRPFLNCPEVVYNDPETSCGDITRLKSHLKHLHESNPVSFEEENVMESVARAVHSSGNQSIFRRVMNEAEQESGGVVEEGRSSVCFEACLMAFPVSAGVSGENSSGKHHSEERAAPKCV